MRAPRVGSLVPSRNSAPTTRRNGTASLSPFTAQFGHHDLEVTQLRQLLPAQYLVDGVVADDSRPTLPGQATHARLTRPEVKLVERHEKRTGRVRRRCWLLDRHWCAPTHVPT